MPDVLTSYLGLTKPDLDGPANEAVLATNFDIIDAAVAGLAAAVAAATGAATGIGAYVATSVNYAVLAGDGVVAATGAITITLPTAVGRTLPITVKKMDAGTTTTVQTTAGQTVDGFAPPVLLVMPNTSLTFKSTGAAWVLV